ncbi:antibiotic biosynthesis monooxygenase family protein [Noviherbaspirillum pedocola]|uniref:Antibiotic biosynthesis monooxygenase n=1 Tax=Noviherbaspirillum pedocola TaxID=2801341 RepID=A0A934SVK6_9BURK|nr:antibiotic biosynthesis monooxygenase family protein [Noviherbaspirillum pedocola]MBK4737385.1 antibiotic biosynthesis monooxygenase [Noviherbaspirillum pedocola]
MYMRMAWFKVRPGRWTEYETLYKNSMKPAPGLKWRLLSRDVNHPDAGYVVSVWDSLETLQSWESSDYFDKVFMPSIQPLLEGGLTIAVCEVQHFEAPTPPSPRQAD